MAFQYISGEQVRRLLPVADCICVMRRAMMAVSKGEVNIPPRFYFPPDDNDQHWFGVMPGGSPELKYYGAKLLSEHRDNPAKGMPAIQGGVLLFDRETGEPKALIDGSAVTEIRTAAASALATDILSSPAADSCGIFGTGAQAVAHIDAIHSVRPLKQVLVYGRSYKKTCLFAEQQANRTGLDILAVESPEQAAENPIVCTVSSASEPILKGLWLQPGTHVNLVGAYSKATREADSELISKAAVYVDSMESCLNEAGDILIPLGEGTIERSHILGEIGQIINAEIAGRQSPDQITLYKSLGLVAQDLFAGQYVLDRFQAEAYAA